MMPRWSRAIGHLRRVGSAAKNTEIRREKSYFFQCRSFSKVAAAEIPTTSDVTEKSNVAISPVNLNKMFRSKPCSLALPPDSPQRIEEPNHQGFQRIILTLLLFYSNQSKAIRGANVIYHRVISRVDKPTIYNVFSLEKNFQTTFTLLVLHMWLCLRRLKEEGVEGRELGQYLYETYNKDLELRANKAGVNLLLTKWMKELERIFYGNVLVYDEAMGPDAKQDMLQNVIWKNIFSGGDSAKPDSTALPVVQAFSRYVRRECQCLLLTEKEAMFSGNFAFTPLENPKA